MLIMYTFFSKLYNKIFSKVHTISRVTLSRSHVALRKTHKQLLIHRRIHQTLLNERYTRKSPIQTFESADQGNTTAQLFEL